MPDDGRLPAGVDTRLLEEDAEDLYENAPCGYLSTLPDGLIVKTNGTFLRWTGYTRADLVGGRRFIDLLASGGRIFYETHVAPLLRMQGFVREIAFDVVSATGDRMPVLVNAIQRIDEGGSPAIVRITVFDASDRRRYERELLLARNRAEQAAQARANLVAMISHDIRGPLSAMLAATALLEKLQTDDRQARFIRVLRSSCDRAVALVNTVLDFSRLEAGEARLSEEAVDLPQLIDDVVSGVRMIAAQKPELVVQADVDLAMPRRLIADGQKLAQILGNLMGNAVKFTERGSVTLSARVRELVPEGATLEIAVSDTGIGIPAERLPQIFDAYTQASSDIAAKYGGTGLGLAISRRLVELHGSELRVESTLGQGTTFSFVVRLRRAAADGAA